MLKVTNIFNQVDRILSGISAFTLLIMVFWICLDVTLRTFFSSPIPGTIEITGEYFMVLLVFLSVSCTQKKNEHVKVTILEERVSVRVRNLFRVIVNIIAAVFFFIISILNFKESFTYLEKGIRSVGVLNYPLAPALMIISLGLLMMSLRLIFECIAIIFLNSAICNSESTNTD